MSRRPEHRRETARFWRENRAEAALREQCLVPAEEYERFTQALERALAEHQRREEERILQVTSSPLRLGIGLASAGPTSPLSPRRWRLTSGRPSAGGERRCKPRSRSVSCILPWLHPGGERALHSAPPPSAPGCAGEGLGAAGWELCSLPEILFLFPESHSASTRATTLCRTFCLQAPRRT